MNLSYMLKERAAQGKPVVFDSGVRSGPDAVKALAMGATAVGIGTGLFYDPMICRKVNAGIASYLHEHGLRSVREIVGSLRTATGAVDTPVAG